MKHPVHLGKKKKKRTSTVFLIEKSMNHSSSPQRYTKQPATKNQPNPSKRHTKKTIVKNPGNNHRKTPPETRNLKPRFQVVCDPGGEFDERIFPSETGDILGPSGDSFGLLVFIVGWKPRGEKNIYISVIDGQVIFFVLSIIGKQFFFSSNLYKLIYMLTPPPWSTPMMVHHCYKVYGHKSRPFFYVKQTELVPKNK